jgi:hypothetical protein
MIEKLPDSPEAEQTPLTRIQSSVNAARSIFEQPLVPGVTGVKFRGYLRNAINAAREIVCDDPLRKPGDAGYPTAAQGLEFLKDKQPGFTDTFEKNLNGVVEELNQQERELINR